LRNTQHIGKKYEEPTKLRSEKHSQKMEPDRDPTIHQHAQAGSQKERREKHFRS
jgi:hypothetical protein